ncbi:cytochrome c [Hydrogenophilus thermoluteolus]|uniref:Cytochrome c n=2 Tax=Hydrogenophilus thermoluteolus TaxID=297 RepID=A0A2Z6DWP5_HYDTE|nr:cytochrome c [Hydrogenophilus thermoluteolus]
MIALLANGFGSYGQELQTPSDFLTAFTAEAQRQDPQFRPDPQRGGAFFRKRFAQNDRMPSCSSCHTENPVQEGRHVITGKTIAPLAPRANPERFTNPRKVAKWFHRNCTEVVGRECTAAERADFIAFLLGT